MSNLAKSITPRMSNDDLTLVNFIVKRLLMTYCDDTGKPVYARSMNRVMEDLFGVKKFTKVLHRAVRSEPQMIALMKRLGHETMFRMTRNSEHYRMLQALVRIDHEILGLRKKQDKIINLEPSERPSNKYRKLGKQIKRYTKIYNRCVSTMRDVFEIKRKKGGKIDELLDFATDWRENYGEHDIFYDLFDGGDGHDNSETESIRDFLRKSSDKKPRSSNRRQRPAPTQSVFGLDDEDEVYDSLFDDVDTGLEQEADDDEFGPESDRLLDAVSQLIDAKLGAAGVQPGSYPRSAPTRPRPSSRGPVFQAAPQPADVNSIILQKLDANNELLRSFLEAVTDDDSPEPEYGYEYDGDVSSPGVPTATHVTSGVIPTPAAPSGPTIQDMIAMSNEGGPRDTPPVVTGDLIAPPEDYPDIPAEAE